MGVKVTLGKCSELMSEITKALFGQNNKILFITTLNPEIILASQEDEEYFSVLNQADIALSDGVGLFFAGLTMGYRLNRKTGTDAVAYLLALCDKNKLKVLVVNWRRGLQTRSEIIERIKSKYPNIEVRAIDVERGDKVADICNLSDFRLDLVLCTLGAPWQEKAMLELKQAKIGRVLIGCGGALDFILGKVKRAPLFFRKLGIEWLWRIFTQKDGQRTKRIKRILHAVLIFPYRFLRWRFVLPWLYRPNVACLVYKKISGKYKIIIVERSDQPGHWQLPQGGLDGHSVAEGGILEARQELNTDKLAVRKTFGYLYKYKFPKEGLSQSSFTGLRHYGYRGQKQALAIIEFIGADNEIHVNEYDHKRWRWVDLEDLVNAVHERRREAAKIYLDKFKQVII